MGSSPEDWLDFFLEAGVAEGPAETYAVTFAKNHMKLDMLSELNKEYLTEMGITCIGHIIGILRHAKAAHAASITKSEMLKKAENAPLAQNPREKEEEAKATRSAAKSPATRMISHYMPKSSAGSSEDGEAKKKHSSVGVKRTQPVNSPTLVKTPKVVQRVVVPEFKKEEEHEEEAGEEERLSAKPEEDQWDHQPKLSNSRNSSVFSRLGGRAEKEEKKEEKRIEVKNSLPIKPPSGPPTIMLKTTKIRQGSEINLPVAGIFGGKTMRADQPEVPVHARTNSATIPTFTIDNREKRGSVKARLGGSGSAVNGDLPTNVKEEKRREEDAGGQERSWKRPARVRQFRRLSALIWGPPSLHPVAKNVKQEKLEESPLEDNVRVKSKEQPRREGQKKVSFGSVSQQLIPGRAARKEPRPGPPVAPDDFRFLGSIGLGTGVFSRLGKP